MKIYKIGRGGKNPFSFSFNSTEKKKGEEKDARDLIRSRERIKKRKILR